jgi:hypothetical protein
MVVAGVPADSAGRSKVTTMLLPVVPGYVETRLTPFIAGYHDLAAPGYVEEQYLFSGKASFYTYIGDVCAAA